MWTILITGTSTGLGFAIATAVARAGHDVFATMRNPANSPELQLLAAKENLPISVVPLDVDSDESVTDSVGKILELRGRIDVLVNNAGIRTFIDLTEERELWPYDHLLTELESRSFAVTSPTAVRVRPSRTNSATTSETGWSERDPSLILMLPHSTGMLAGPVNCAATTPQSRAVHGSRPLHS